MSILHRLTTPPIPPDAAAGRTGEFPAAAPPPRALDRLRLPGPRALVGGIILGRLVLVGLVFGSALGAPATGVPAPARILAGLIGLVAIGWFTVVSRDRSATMPATTLSEIC